MEWENIQNQICCKLDLTNTVDMASLKLVGGFDISFEKANGIGSSCGYLTIIDYQTNTIVYEDHELIHLDIPYISGFLAFREVPVYLLLYNRLFTIKPEFIPHVIMVDGFGILHPRKCGIACQLGYELNIPTIGIGKTLMCCDGIDEKKMKSKFAEVCHKKGDHCDIIGN